MTMFIFCEQTTRRLPRAVLPANSVSGNTPWFRSSCCSSMPHTPTGGGAMPQTLLGISRALDPTTAEPELVV